MRTKPVTNLFAIALAFGLAACGSPAGPEGGEIALASGSGSGEPEIRMEIPLISVDPTIPDAKGKAKFRDKGGEKELEIQVENLPQAGGGLPNPGPAPFSIVPIGGSGDPVEFFVNGAFVGSSAIDALGNARLNINTDLGDAVPMVFVGDVVLATLNGVPVVQGTF